MASAIYANAITHHEAQHVIDALEDLEENNTAHVRILDRMPRESNLPASETDMAPGLLRGGLWGALGGLLTGLVLSMTLGGPITMMLTLGAGVGLIYGLLGGALAGMTTRHRSFEDLRTDTNRSDVIVRVDLSDESARERVLTELRRRGMHAIEPSHNSSFRPSAS